MDVGLARAGRAADGQLLERTAVAAHGVTLKVDKNQHTVVVFNVLAPVSYTHLARGVENMQYTDLTKKELQREYNRMARRYTGFVREPLQLDMAEEDPLLGKSEKMCIRDRF